MAMFESGVASYILTTATVCVSFPVDHKGNADISCNQCQFYRRSAKLCGLTADVVEYPEKYVGSTCPLMKIEEEQKNEEN